MLTLLARSSGDQVCYGRRPSGAEAMIVLADQIKENGQVME
jgi:hypothetical protein